MNLLCSVAAIWIASSITTQVVAQIGCDFDCASLNGILDGGRCFFFGSVNSINWDEAWIGCSTHGGTLAQLHSDSEFEKLVQFATTTYAPLSSRDNGRVVFFLPLKYDTGYDGNAPCDESRSSHAYWYDSVIDKSIPAMSATNTWLKNHICDDTDNIWANEIVFVLTVDISGGLIKDCVWNPALTIMPLCMMNTYNHNYTQSSGICINEQPLETITPVQQPQECADACTARLWCRSFNYVIDDSFVCDARHCALFSRSISDTSTYRVNTTVANGSCIHYNYIP